MHCGAECDPRELCAVDPQVETQEDSGTSVRGRWHREAEIANWSWGMIRPLFGPSIVVALAYCLFKYVITDEGMVLDYLRALAWPFVIVGVVFWVRVPLANRLESLESFDSPWGRARFGREVATRLADEVESDLSPFGRAVDEGIEPISTSGSEESSSEDAAPVSEASERGSALNDATEGHLEADGGDGPSDPSAEPLLSSARVNQIRAAEIRNIASELEIRGDAYFRAVQGAEENPDRAAERLTAEIRGRLRQLSQRNEQVLDQARSSLESVIQKSAQWGYEMGRAGAPRAVPDIEWNADGTWKITTEVPARRQVKESSTRARQIQSIVDEIKELDRRDNVAPGVSMLSERERTWLFELKRKLAMADPGNPWAI